jgi:hypothetical protein
MLAGMALSTLEAAAGRLATLRTVGGGALGDPTGVGLQFEAEVTLRPLARGAAPEARWPLAAKHQDGRVGGRRGQALVADARCLQLVVTRASRVRFRGRACVLPAGPLPRLPAAASPA